ncbi:zinc-binding metallopeptidase family protein [Roseomonas chloroacetimidivorans]|uniref:zinc-binding metallopeptidase family protein n=1 Tax=Roseomonas chloroacetimidivorans TaxID=1766656 RepID=UPI003C77499C
MRLFRCQACGETVYFENTRCGTCSSHVGYLPEVGLMSALEPEVSPELVEALQQVGLQDAAKALHSEAEVWLARVWPGRRYRFCSNAQLQVCNWMVPAESKDSFCLACRHNRCISDPTQRENLARWRKLEGAKHRLFYSMVKLQLPLLTRDKQRDGLAFDFLDDPPDPDAPRVVTGHSNGLITIALREADDVERERMRKVLGERYRTLLGHLRHETGHYFWDRLVRDGDKVEACRAVFGDEGVDYSQALRTYYADGPPAGWQSCCITAYATAHPWEDFAESWAHYLHMVDTLETAAAHGMEIHPRNGARRFRAVTEFDPYRPPAFDLMIENWLPLSQAANSLNRSMGQPDLYPFVLSPLAVEKLCFIHGLVQEHRSS